jgi:HEAT repeat protein
VASNPHPAHPGAPEKNQLKVQGLAFGQAFQTVFKVGAMYSVDHPAAGRSMQQSWDLLVPLLKLGRQFTFGFMNQRVLLNSSLVSSTNLTHLEVEFTKREIAAITFQAGVTQKDYKRALALLTTRALVIAERGGIRKFLTANPIEGVRVSPLVKPKEGDITEVGMDMDSFLTAQAILGPEGSSGSSALDLLLDAAGTRKAQAIGASPQELVAVADAATRNTIADPDGNVAELLVALTQMLSGLRPDFVVAALPPQRQADLQGQSAGVLSAHLMENAIAGWAAERLSSAAGAGVEGGGAGPGGEGKGGAGAGEGSGTGAGAGGTGGGAGGEGKAEGGGSEGRGGGGGSRGNVEIEVLQALLRGLKATRVAERLMQKLAQFVEQANLPVEVYDRIHREVMWFTLPAEKKHAQLLSQRPSTPLEFTRLVQYVQEAMSEGKISEATDIAQHYFSSWEKAPAAVRAEELKRAPELLRALASVQTLPLMHTLAEPLLGEIVDETRLHWPCHREATHCLAVVAQNAGRFEDFEFVHKIASDLKRSMTRRPAQHADCCGRALAGFLTPEALERLIDSLLQRRSDAAWVHTAISLLAMIGPPGAEAALHRLEEEPAASNRLPLIRMIRNLGACAIEPTRKRLSDPRWYVVRNAAYLLGDLGDPELPTQLRGAIRHQDFRVQQAAMTAILRSNVAGRAQILAQALSELQAGVLELALDELTVLKDPSSVEHLEALVLGKKEFKARVLEKAVIALGAVPSDRAAEGLFKITADAAQPLLVRRTALGILYNHSSALAAGWVAQLANLSSSDPLAAEVRKVA